MEQLLKDAIKKRDEFLEENPKYKEYQRELEITLSGIKDPVLRLSILMSKISKNMNKVNQILGGLKNEVGIK